MELCLLLHHRTSSSGNAGGKGHEFKCDKGHSESTSSWRQPPKERVDCVKRQVKTLLTHNTSFADTSGGTNERGN